MHKQEDVRTLSVGDRDKIWDLPFGEVFDVLGYRFHRDGKGFRGTERTMCKALRSWWSDKYIYRSKTVPMMDGSMHACPQPCVQHSPEWQSQEAVEWRHDQRSTCLGGRTNLRLTFTDETWWVTEQGEHFVNGKVKGR